jgi:lysozyme
MSIVKLLKFEEGFRSKPYKCTAGVWTNGYGNTHGVTATTKPVTKEQAERTLMLEIGICVSDVAKALPWSSTLDICRRDVLVAMRYQLGLNGLLDFPMFLKAMRDHNWEEAARQLRNSMFYRQTTNRVERLMAMVLTGDYPDIIFSKKV